MADLPTVRTHSTRRAQSKPLTGYIDLDVLGEDPSHIPTKEDFVAAWGELDALGKQTVSALLRGETFRDYMREIKKVGITATGPAKARMNPKPVMRAFYYGLVAKMSSHEAKVKLIKNVITPTTMMEVTQRQIESLVMTDEGHLTEMAAKLRVDGDGKRAILQRLVAYGMQTKQMEAPIVDEAGEVLAKAVYGLADPKVAYSAVQELNRMDHEYGEDDKATSSIEGQAERIRRLAVKMAHAQEKKDREKVNIAKAIMPRDLT